MIASIAKCLLCVRYCSKCFSGVLFNLHNFTFTDEDTEMQERFCSRAMIQILSDWSVQKYSPTS